MMGELSAFLRRRFRRANIETTIVRDGVGRDNFSLNAFSAKVAREFNCARRFT
jgi:hypothetical protein